MKNRGITPIITNLVGVHPSNIQTKTKFEANPCSGSREVEKLKKSSRRQQSRRLRRTQEKTSMWKKHLCQRRDRKILHNRFYRETMRIYSCLYIHKFDIRKPK